MSSFTHGLSPVPGAAGDVAAAIQSTRELDAQISKLTDPKTFKLDGLSPDTLCWFDSVSREFRFLTTPVAPRTYTAADVSDFARLTSSMVAERLGLSTCSTFVFVLNGRAEAILDQHGDRRETVTLELSRSDAYTAFVALNGKFMGQKALVSELRTGIAGTYEPGNIVAMLSKLKFSKSTGGASEIRVGRESMGMSIAREVSGIDGDLPDDLDITFPVYDDFVRDGKPVLSTIRCSLDINTEDSTIRIKAKAGELARVLLESDTALMHNIAARITSPNGVVQIFRGEPH